MKKGHLTFSSRGGRITALFSLSANQWYPVDVFLLLGIKPDLGKMNEICQQITDFEANIITVLQISLLIFHMN